MFIIFTFIITITKALISTTSTCSYVPQSSGSIDIRQEILNLGPNSTIADLDTTYICNNYGNQDFLTLLQIWIPSKYNFYNKTNPTKANDYRELYNIKEYLFDPALGTLTQLYQFLNSLKDQCPHLKILGEFSFHIGQDSYLLQNVSRFLRRPSNANPNIQNPRYDQKGFVWARNDIGKRIPGSAVWNIFDPTVLSDIYQIQLTLLSQHQLDGISFIYPSLGLYQIANQFYGPEISAYGTITQDFYQSWASTSIAKNCFNVGLFDSSLQKYKLFSSYLQYVSSFNAYTQPRFFDVNHTFDLVNSSSLYTKEPNSIVLNTEGDTKLAFIVTQVNTTQPTCIKFNISSYNDSLPGNIIVGMANLEGAVVNNFDANVQIRLFAVNSSSQKIIFKLDTSINGTQGFSIPPNSQLELQYNANTKNFIIKILGKQTAYKSFMIDYTKLTMNMTNLRYTAGTNITGLNISISFPYYFSKDSPNWQNLGDRNIELKDNPYSLHQFAIIEPSIHYLNQIQILNVRQQSTSIICIGAAAKYVIKQKNYQCNFNQLGCGAYLICSNGFTFHNSDSTINNKAQTITFSKSNIMSLYYQDSDYSLTVYKDSVLFYKFIMDRTNKMRVLNFCVASITPGGSLSLEY